jgi:hypothetical protein
MEDIISNVFHKRAGHPSELATSLAFATYKAIYLNNIRRYIRNNNYYRLSSTYSIFLIGI